MVLVGKRISILTCGFRWKTLANCMIVEQMNQQSWEKFCKTFRFDPNDTNPHKEYLIPGMKQTVWIWQLYAASWMLRREYSTGGGFLSDEMGSRLLTCNQ